LFLGFGYSLVSDCDFPHFEAKIDAHDDVLVVSQICKSQEDRRMRLKMQSKMFSQVLFSVSSARPKFNVVVVITSIWLEDKKNSEILRYSIFFCCFHAQQKSLEWNE